jgi:hypothetical protein
VVTFNIEYHNGSAYTPVGTISGGVTLRDLCEESVPATARGRAYSERIFAQRSIRQRDFYDYRLEQPEHLILR